MPEMWLNLLGFFLMIVSCWTHTGPEIASAVKTVFQAAQGDNQLAQGICSPTAGGVFPNEHYVWTIAPSVSAMMSNPGFFTEKNTRKQNQANRNQRFPTVRKRIKIEEKH